MLVTPDGGLLLQLRDDKPDLLWANHWTLFGGSVEPGEPPVTAVARELVEELELSLPLSLWHRFPCPYRSQPGELVCMHYAYWGVLDVPLETLVLHEGQRFGVFTPDEAAAMTLAFNQQEVVRDFIATGIAKPATL
jgi:8-oxo-dGTP diphosphatase